MSGSITLRLDDDLENRLDQLAIANHRSKTLLAIEAIRDFVELQEWQVHETQVALTEADNGEFASATEVAATFSKWGVDAN